MFAQEPKEGLAADEVCLKWLHGLSGELVLSRGNRAGQTYDLAGLGDAHDQRFAIRRTRAELHTAIAQDEHSAGLLTFDEKKGTFGIGRQGRYGLKSLQVRDWQIAKDAVVPERANEA